VAVQTTLGSPVSPPLPIFGERISGVEGENG